jgi:hypothetical protein
MAENKCDICGKHELLPFTCRYCGGVYCSTHRLPENHDCSGLSKLKERARSERVIDSRGTYKARKKGGFPDIRLPFQGYYAYAILALAIVVFILQMLFSPWFTQLLSLSGGQGLINKPWGILTHMFLHGGFNHLFFNMLALFFFGPLLERRIGSSRFLAVFLGCGIIAGLVQVLIFPATSVIGASGAIFGILGVLTVLMPELIIYLYFIPMKIAYAVILFALIDLVFLPTGDGVAHAAHLAGLVAGLLIGYFFKKKTEIPQVYLKY